MDLQNKFVLITGASRGIGLALAKAFAAEKAHLILAVRKMDSQILGELKTIGAPSVGVIESDFSTFKGVEDFCKHIEEKNLSVDILVNNAGLLTGGLLETQELKSIYDMIQVNLSAVIHLSHFFVPRMLKAGRGKIINNASVSGKMFIPCANTYAAAKAGVVALTESLRGELKGTGVSTLVLITPGVKTDMYDQIPKQYGSNLDLSFLSSISADEWARKVIQAVKTDQTELWPSGASGWVVRLAHHFPHFFQKIIATRFRR